MVDFGLLVMFTCKEVNMEREKGKKKCVDHKNTLFIIIYMFKINTSISIKKFEVEAKQANTYINNITEYSKLAFWKCLRNQTAML